MTNKDEQNKMMACKWFRNGSECGKGLPGTPCELEGCVAWEHSEEDKYMKIVRGEEE